MFGDMQGGGLQALVAGRGRAAWAARGQRCCEAGKPVRGAGGIHSHLTWAGSTLLGRRKWTRQELITLQNPLLLG